MRHYKTLTWNDRLQIEAWRKVGVSPRQMAAELHVHISTVYREFKRGQYEHLNSDYTTEIRYSPDISEAKKQERLRAKGGSLKIGNDHNFAQFVEFMIGKEKYSPGATLLEIQRRGIVFNTSVSKTTLYRYIDQGVFLTITNKNLPVKRNQKKGYKKVRQKKVSRGTSIEKRPLEIAKRVSFGHWEMDCVEGKKKTKKTLLVLTERFTRREIIRLMPSKTAESVVKTLDALEKEIGVKKFHKMFLSITVDNGGEFSDTAGIERSYRGKTNRTTVYYCHPYSSYERGSNENQNKMVRRHYPKGTSFENVSASEIAHLEKWINNYPRKIFGFYSSEDLFQEQLKSLFSAV